MEYVSEGELLDCIIQVVSSEEEREAQMMFAQIVYAAQYCHDHHTFTCGLPKEYHLKK